jgi:DNA-binding beta-propeller fold protein YncE
MNKKLISLCILSGIFFFLFVSCSRNVTKSKKKKEKEIVMYPPPPDTARIQFLTSISSSENTIGKQSSVSKYIFGESEPKPIKKPYGITIHGGKIYICDVGIGGLEIIDLEKNTFEYFDPRGKGQLKLPLNCFVDEDGKLYVADGQRRQVVVFDQYGNYLESIGDTARFKPTDVFICDDKIWVSNIIDNKINVFNKETLELMFSFPDAEKGKEDFLYSPTNIYLTYDKVYVSDMGDFKVKIYDHNGKFLSSVGSNGSNIGQFVRPKGIAVDQESNLYAVDAGFENTQIFNKVGKVLMFFGGPYKGRHGDMWLPAKVAINYDNLKYFQKYVDPGYTLKYLVFVTNQYGPDKVNIYGFVAPKK